MLVAALFITVKMEREPKCSSENEQANTAWSVPTREQHSAMRTEAPAQAPVWLSLAA